VLAAACASSGSGKPAGQGAGGSAGMAQGRGGFVPFAPLPPSAAVAKVKNLLVGLPPTDDEVAAVAADPSEMRGLVAGWMQLPEYQQTLLRFFELSLQQTQISDADLDDQAYPRKLVLNQALKLPLTQN